MASASLPTVGGNMPAPDRQPLGGARAAPGFRGAPGRRVTALGLLLFACSGPRLPVPDAGTPDAGDGPDAGPGPGDGGPTADGGSTANPWRLSVLTINLWHDFPGFSNLEARTKIVSAFIAARRPDLVAVQEAGQGATLGNRCEVLAQQTGYACRWISAGGTPAVFAEGPGVLSRWPILDVAHLDLPHPQESGLVRRKALWTSVETPRGVVRLVSTHFSNGEGAAAESDRLDQAVALEAFVEQRAGGLSTLIGGDFNSAPDSAAPRFLRGALAVGGVTSRLRDAWLEASPTLPGYTEPAANPTARIDYIYAAPAASAGARAIACEVVLEALVNGIRASDHLGVLCELELNAP